MENQIAQPKKKTSIVTWIVLGFIVVVVLIGITANNEENKTTKPETVQPQQQVSGIIKFVNSPNGLRLRAKPSLSAEILEVLEDKTRVEVLKQQNDWSEVKVGEKQGWVASRYLSEEERADFKITTEELYSMYLRTRDASGWKKYDGKIVEVTGIVLSARDYFSKSSVIPELSEEKKEKILELRKKTIPKDERCLVQLTCKNCLDEDGEQGCMLWAYSSSPQLIKGIRKGDRITVIGRFKWVEDLAPELRDSKVKNIF